MNTFAKSSCLIISFFLLFSEECLMLCKISSIDTRQRIHAFSYDYSATTKCLANPLSTSRGGLLNTVSFDRILQKVRFEKGKLYIFSAWVQISEGSENVALLIRTARGELTRCGYVIAKHGCWSLLKGGLIAEASGLVDIIFQCKNSKVGVSVENVSLQEFTMNQWKSHQDKSIDTVRKTKVKLQAIYANKTAASRAIISIKQIKSHFPFGCAMNHHILTSKDYQNWFASRFKYTTFTNEMKWYSTEAKDGQENYTIPDLMLQFAKNNGIKVRGHNILWDNPNEQPQWTKKLNSNELWAAAIRRVDSVTRRYSGRVIGWDVMNENLHWNFFESKYGENASAEIYARAYLYDPRTRMFMNEFNTIEYSADETANPENYLRKLEEIIEYSRNKGMKVGIGLRGHFGSGQPNLVYMRSVLDFFGATKLPVWLTEVSIGIGPNQEKYLEQILREGYSHPAVKGIIMFAGPKIAGFNDTVLADENFDKTRAGNVVYKLISEWKIGDLNVVADTNGFAQLSRFHGDYVFTVKHPVTDKPLVRLVYKVGKKKLPQIINLVISD